MPAHLKFAYGQMMENWKADHPTLSQSLSISPAAKGCIKVKSAGETFAKVLYVATLNVTYTMALTFQNLCQPSVSLPFSQQLLLLPKPQPRHQQNKP